MLARRVTLRPFDELRVTAILSLSTAILSLSKEAATPLVKLFNGLAFLLDGSTGTSRCHKRHLQA